MPLKYNVQYCFSFGDNQNYSSLLNCVSNKKLTILVSLIKLTVLITSPIGMLLVIPLLSLITMVCHSYIFTTLWNIPVTSVQDDFIIVILECKTDNKKSNRAVAFKNLWTAWCWIKFKQWLPIILSAISRLILKLWQRKSAMFGFIKIEQKSNI